MPQRRLFQGGDMLGKDKLRGIDVLSGLIFILFGIWVLISSLAMPLRVSYANAKNVWYVSPALFPLIIGIGIIVLSTAIGIHGIRNDGVQQLRTLLKNVAVKTDKNLRYLCILTPLGTLVYLTLERIDFVQSTMFFLFFTVLVFYIDNKKVMKNVLLWFFGIMFLYFVVAVSGFQKTIESNYPYLIDVASLFLFITLCIFSWVQIRHDNEYRRRYRITLYISIIIPFLLAVVFRFILRVPLPKEGGFTDLLYVLFSLFGKRG
jgi:hypothetical protein